MELKNDYDWPREIAPELDLQMVLSQPLPERVITNLYFDPSKSVDVDMTDRQHQTENARRERRERDWRQRFRILNAIAQIVYEQTGCPKCRQKQWCRNQWGGLSCMSASELARTLTTLKVETSMGKTNWSPTQVKNALSHFTPEPPTKDGPLDEFFQ